MASPIAKTWLNNTMLIENDWGEFGTGFLIFRVIKDTKGKLFLVTNKHVLNSNENLRAEAEHIKLYFNVENPDGSLIASSEDIGLDYPDGSKIWRRHHDSDTDVIAFDVTPLMNKYPAIYKWYPDYSLFANQTMLAELDITIGEEIMVIGYPLGLRQGETNFPLVRGGIIATRIGEAFIDEVKCSGGMRQRSIRGFLIDGATIIGSSGSPVVLKPATGRIIKNNIMMSPPQPVLLGILSEAKYTPLGGRFSDPSSYTGLGLAFDSKTIKETIELFFS